MTNLEAKKSLLSCPGDTIQETIDEIGMSQAELAERIGRSVPKLNELIKGKAPITKETATKLEYVLGIPAIFWLNLERSYQDELLEIEQMEFLERCIEWLKAFPVSAMKKLGLLPKTNESSVLVESLLKFFRVASPVQWSSLYTNNELAFKINLNHTAEPQAISVWLRLGELQAEKIQTAEFDKKLIRERFDKIQDICFRNPENWKEALQQICSECGIALVYTPCISKAPIYGATRWIRNSTKPLIQITDRQKDYNAFWFTFFHELAHILLHGKKDIFIEGLGDIAPDKEKEDEADAFAARMLLSEKERNELFRNTNYSTELIRSFSQKYKKNPSIIVSQIQREGKIEYSDFRLNRLKIRVEFGRIIL
ncbi:MAG: HigA family addiction module antitoxin [Paludibacter sp. 47-17]|nr:MAG: HigA family addiction module antitoxin [Paludibacter sp. 47-17]